MNHGNLFFIRSLVDKHVEKLVVSQMRYGGVYIKILEDDGEIWLEVEIDAENISFSIETLEHEKLAQLETLKLALSEKGIHVYESAIKWIAQLSGE